MSQSRSAFCVNHEGKVPFPQEIKRIVEQQNLNSIQKIFNEKMFIGKPENVQGAGMILFRNGDLNQLEVLLIKEKHPDQKGKWGFPKGKTQYQCHQCQIKNCEKHRSCLRCQGTEQLCRSCRRCYRCQKIKATPFCSRHRIPIWADNVAETKGECALREVYQEIGVDYQKFPHIVVGWVRIGRNTFFLVFTENPKLIPQDDEIEEITWVNFDSLDSLVQTRSTQYNMGIRRLVTKHHDLSQIWLPYCHQLYQFWFYIKDFLQLQMKFGLSGDLSLFFWILIDIQSKGFLSVGDQSRIPQSPLSTDISVAA